MGTSPHAAKNFPVNNQAKVVTAGYSNPMKGGTVGYQGNRGNASSTAAKPYQGGKGKGAKGK